MTVIDADAHVIETDRTWEFMPEERHGKFSDSGRRACHGPPASP